MFKSNRRSLQNDVFLLTLDEMNINQYLILDLDLGEDKSIESIEKMN